MVNIAPNQPSPPQPFQLTTPLLLKDEDELFPGENWFFYWKIGSRLWKSKFEDYSRSGPILLPINWSFHTDTGDNFDFATHRPETNLKKLVATAKEVGREISFLLPFGPVPFIPNGGLPHLLAKVASLNNLGLVQGAISANSVINKMYSFFDSSIFKAYAKFTDALGAYFTSSGIDCNVWGMDAGYIEGGGFKSFLFDHSSSYQDSLDQFKTASREKNPKQVYTDKILERDFCQFIRETYLNQAARGLGGNWEGFVRVGFVGSGPQDFFERLEGEEREDKFIGQTLKILSAQALPSSALIPGKMKEGVWGKVLEDQVVGGVTRDFNKAYEMGQEGEFIPLKFFEFYHHKKDYPTTSHFWDKIHLLSYLQKEYRWTYLQSRDDEIKWSEIENSGPRIHFLQGQFIDQKLFQNIIKLLMSGHNIVLDGNQIPPTYVRRIESFFLENDLRVNKIKFHTEISHIKLGESHLIIFDSKKLRPLSKEKITHFWRSLLAIFTINHLAVKLPTGVEIYWRTRFPSPIELSYEEIRRASFYNTTSDKKKLNIDLPGNFKLLRIIDQRETKIANAPGEITLKMASKGSVSLDFGVFS